MAAIDAHVGRDRLVPADALELLLLQHAQHLGLRGRGHVADLVEEERAAVGLLELADALPVGAGERALLVAEQFALEQRLGDRGAVDRQERLVGAVGVLVDRAGDQFLAGAALAEDQHGHVLGGDAADGLVDLLHGRRAADDRVGARRGDLGSVGSPKTAGVACIRRSSNGLANDLLELVQIDRLEQVLERAALHRLDGGVGRCRAR